MRELKYRAYDLEKKRWIKEEGITFTSKDSTKGSTALSESGHLRVFYADHIQARKNSDDNFIDEDCLISICNSEYESVHPCYTKPTYKRQYALMLFTGKSDIWGNDIYEGDLVEDQQGEVSEVKWDEEELGFNIRNSWKLLIVGNIYDKPKTAPKSNLTKKG